MGNALRVTKIGNITCGYRIASTIGRWILSLMGNTLPVRKLGE